MDKSVGAENTKPIYKLILDKYKKLKANCYGDIINYTFYKMSCIDCGYIQDTTHKDYLYRKCRACQNISYKQILPNGSEVIADCMDQSKKSHKKVLEVKCHCGKYFSFTRLSFTRCRTKNIPIQCKNCHILESNKKNAKTDVDSEILRFMKSYIESAKSRNYPFELNFEEFKKLCLDKCYYCGEAFTNYVQKIKYNETNKNGIDRKNNNEGYTLENSVTCCGTCNKIKQTFSDIEFLDQVDKIYKHQKIRKNEL